MIFFKVVMLGRLTWLECRLWLAVAGITRFCPDYGGDDCGDCNDGDDCDDCDDSNVIKNFFHDSILLGLLVSLGLASALSLPYTPIIIYYQSCLYHLYMFIL